eukprot:CAMPEP_0117663660 /NCGR_PEP_ID=MMETSP0804-20121206/8746_1 /TAXON_ID=1074897 /ORGANISM="Tetraselmis astigmatica, Strain CCMP880" /LENGTH=181 /DNA_ID=CAMNT_0005470723 /DNA_START=542 /DNA_END=1087 /DNA_ORIENTATION=+
MDQSYQNLSEFDVCLTRQLSRLQVSRVKPSCCGLGCTIDAGHSETSRTCRVVLAASRGTASPPTGATDRSSPAGASEIDIGFDNISQRVARTVDSRRSSAHEDFSSAAPAHSWDYEAVFLSEGSSPVNDNGDDCFKAFWVDEGTRSCGWKRGREADHIPCNALHGLESDSGKRLRHARSAC